jgi:glycosyltransferase involved in cell wall biosynthesis
LRIYWYWPHPHRTANLLALATMRPDDTLTVEALPSLAGETFGTVAEYEVVRDLPDPTMVPRWPPARVGRRASIAAGRARARRRLLRRGFDIAQIELLTYQSDWLDLPGIRRRLPVVATVHDVRPHVSKLPTRVETALLRRLYGAGATDRLVVFHEVLREELISDFGVDAARVTVIPIPIDGRDARLRECQPVERPFVLLFGRLRANKGVRILLRAARTLDRDPGFDLRIAGGGDPALEAEVRNAAAAQPWIHGEIGWVSPDRMAQLHSTASMIVLPYTTFHSQSAVLADAYRYRVPLVVTDVGAIGPTVRDDETGWVVPPNDADALADVIANAMRSLLAGEDRAAALDAAATRHDPKSVGPILRAVYDDVRSTR